jgi:hypothetical protein
VAKKNKDRIKTDIEISYLIAEDAYRKITDNQKAYRKNGREANRMTPYLKWRFASTRG